MSYMKGEYDEFCVFERRKNKANLIGANDGFVIPVKLVPAKAGNRNPVLLMIMDSASSAE